MLLSIADILNYYTLFSRRQGIIYKKSTENFAALMIVWLWSSIPIMQAKVLNTEE